MDWISELRGTVVALDTAPLIYFIERSPTCFPLVEAFFKAMDGGEFRVITSTLTLTEVLVHPFRTGSYSLAEKYFQILTSSRNIAILPVSDVIAIEAARFRAETGAKAPDAIQLATARIGGAAAFLTNDARFRSAGDCRVIVLDHLMPHP